MNRPADGGHRPRGDRGDRGDRGEAAPRAQSRLWVAGATAEVDRGGGPRTRVRVTNPRTDAALRARPVRRRRDELADQTAVGDVLIRSLIRAQLGLALRVLIVLVGLLGGMPLLFALAPSVGRADVGGIPLPWLLLGVAAFPLLLLLGLTYARQAERNEREFADLVEP